jgi:pimeloyl-ACP methyl ester carboxylesterase
MARITVEPGFEVNCEIDDFLWPWVHPTPVLMQHGFSRNASFWRRWIPELTASRRVYRPEVRGCGGSDTPQPGFAYSGDTLLGDVLRVLDELDIERVHWVGEASGGVLGVLFAAAHPDRVASLVLVNTPVVVKSLTTTYSFDRASPSAALLELGSAEWCRRTLEHRLDLDLASPELQNFYITEIGKVPAYVSAAMQETFDPIELFPILKSLTLPVLLLTGGKKKVAVEQQALMQREVPQAISKVFDSYGPGILSTAPELCAGEAIKFWESIDPSGA